MSDRTNSRDDDLKQLEARADAEFEQQLDEYEADLRAAIERHFNDLAKAKDACPTCQ